MVRMQKIIIFIMIFITIELNAATIYLKKEEVTVTSDKIYLKDIAEVTDANLANIFITNAPLPGKSKVISREYLILKLRKYKITLNINGGAIKVLRSFRKINKDIEEAINKFLSKKFKDKEFEYEIVSLKDDIIIPDTNDYEVKIDDSNILLNSTLSLPIIILIENKPYRKLNVLVRLTVYDYILVTKEIIKKGEEINNEKFERKRVNILQIRDEVIKDFDEIKNYIARRTIPSNRILRKIDIEEKNMINRGKRIKILAKVNGVEATCYGEALQDGKYNEIIRVRNIDSKKELNAKVIDRDTVEVMF